PLLGFGSREEDLGPAGYDPKAPIKFAYQAKGAVGTVRRYLPYFAGVKSGFEIGVGAGYLMRALIDVQGIAMRGCDINIERLGVYKAIRAELGLTHLVTEQRIEPRRPVVLPPDTEAVIGFLPAWTAKWDLEDYQWFHADLKRQNIRRMYWQMNANIDKPEIRAYFDSSVKRRCPKTTGVS
ncbi:hypothetical protein, partial [Methylobrevis pamukkalensis]|uniref:hypothetical protein n=1 Tax=Methylobrevis pamukkalensis TaxID=1439726 RepID=UPI001470EB50